MRRSQLHLRAESHLIRTLARSGGCRGRQWNKRLRGFFFPTNGAWKNKLKLNNVADAEQREQVPPLHVLKMVTISIRCPRTGKQCVMLTSNLVGLKTFRTRRPLPGRGRCYKCPLGGTVLGARPQVVGPKWPSVQNLSPLAERRLQSESNYFWHFEVEMSLASCLRQQRTVRSELGSLYKPRRGLIAD